MRDVASPEVPAVSHRVANSAPRTGLKVLVLGLRAIVGAQGGIEAHVRDLVTTIAGMPGAAIDFEVVERSAYVDPSRVLPPELANVRLTSIWSPRSTHLEALVHSVLAVLHASVKRPDLVHIHGIGPALVSPLAKLLGLRVVVTHHGQDYAREKWGPITRIVLRVGEYCAAHFADERIVIAPTLDVSLAKRYGRLFRYIPNGIHPATQRGNTTVLQRWGLERGRYVAHVGRFVPEKRQTDLIAAFARIAAPDWRLVLIGGSDHTTPYTGEITKAAASDPRVVLTGALDRAEVADLLEHAGVFALPSTHEGLPIALLEAMSYGLPVLVSNLPNLIALDLPEECYVPIRDVDALAGKLAEIIARDIEEVRRVDWSSWLNIYSMELVAKRTIETYVAVSNIISKTDAKKA